MAKKTKKESAKKESAKEDSAKKDSAKKESTKKESAKKAAAMKSGWDEIAASSPPRPEARSEPKSDALVIVNGIAEIVRLGLGAMDPEERATLLVAIGKVGASLPKKR